MGYGKRSRMGRQDLILHRRAEKILQLNDSLFQRAKRNNGKLTRLEHPFRKEAGTNNRHKEIHKRTDDLSRSGPNRLASHRCLEMHVLLPLQTRMGR